MWASLSENIVMYYMQLLIHSLSKIKSQGQDQMISKLSQDQQFLLDIFQDEINEEKLKNIEQTFDQIVRFRSCSIPAIDDLHSFTRLFRSSRECEIT